MTKIISSFTGEYFFLSNFWTGYPHVSMASLGIGGAFVASGEHAFQAHKAIDLGQQATILAARTPKIAKHLGRGVPLPPWWEDRKREIMLNCLLAKFSFTSVPDGYPNLRKQLAATGDATLIEGNTWGDDYWGAIRVPTGRAPTERELDLPWWRDFDGSLAGHNWLGRLLMMVREIQS